jgi:hypothetical protein
MKTKNPRFGICQDCVEKLPRKVLLSFDVKATKFGPEHSIVLCKNCKAKREKK